MDAFLEAMQIETGSRFPKKLKLKLTVEFQFLHLNLIPRQDSQVLPFPKVVNLKC